MIGEPLGVAGIAAPDLAAEGGGAAVEDVLDGARRCEGSIDAP
jgi:hypothetical protein